MYLIPFSCKLLTHCEYNGEGKMLQAQTIINLLTVFLVINYDSENFLKWRLSSHMLPNNYCFSFKKNYFCEVFTYSIFKICFERINEAGLENLIALQLGWCVVVFRCMSGASCPSTWDVVHAGHAPGLLSSAWWSYAVVLLAPSSQARSRWAAPSCPAGWLQLMWSLTFVVSAR